MNANDDEEQRFFEAVQAASVDRIWGDEDHELFQNSIVQPQESEMDKSYVTMEQHVCPVCGKAHDTGAILMDTRLKYNHKTGRNELRETFDHYTVTGWSLCPEHKKLADEGYVAIVAVDETKTKGPITPENAWRTGSIAHVRRSVWDNIFNAPIDAKHEFVFTSEEAITKLQAMMPKEGT